MNSEWTVDVRMNGRIDEQLDLYHTLKGWKVSA